MSTPRSNGQRKRLSVWLHGWKRIRGNQLAWHKDVKRCSPMKVIGTLYWSNSLIRLITWRSAGRKQRRYMSNQGGGLELSCVSDQSMSDWSRNVPPPGGWKRYGGHIQIYQLLSTQNPYKCLPNEAWRLCFLCVASGYLQEVLKSLGLYWFRLLRFVACTKRLVN